MSNQLRRGLKSLVAAMSEEGIVEDLRFTTLGGGFRSRLVSYGGMAGATAMDIGDGNCWKWIMPPPPRHGGATPIPLLMRGYLVGS